jgi:hypothetical protein
VCFCFYCGIGFVSYGLLPGIPLHSVIVDIGDDGHPVPPPSLVHYNEELEYFELKRKEVTGSYGKLYCEELYNLSSSAGMIKPRRAIWARRVARMGR